MSNINIDGTEYPIAALSDDAKNQLVSMQEADKKIIELQQNLAFIQTARNAYASRLKSLLPDSVDGMLNVE